MAQQVVALVKDEVFVGVSRKKVDDLSLDELKAQLKERCLNYSGDDYAILHERLTDALIEEGVDPNAHEFDVHTENANGTETKVCSIVKAKKEHKKLEGIAAKKSTETKKTLDAANNRNTAANKRPNVKAEAGPAVNDKTKAKPNTMIKSNDSKSSEEALLADKTVVASPVYKEVPGNHLWVSGLVSGCKAADLKKFFSRFADVSSAKIVANARTASSHCYGYITVGRPAELEKCVQRFNGSRFEGRFITVEPCKLGPADQLRKVEIKHRERLTDDKALARGKEQSGSRPEMEAKRSSESNFGVEREALKDMDKRRQDDRKPFDYKAPFGATRKDFLARDGRKLLERRRSRSRSFERRRTEFIRRSEHYLREPFRRSPFRGFRSPSPYRRPMDVDNSFSRSRSRSRSSSPFKRPLRHELPMGHPSGAYFVPDRRFRPMDRRIVYDRERRIEEERLDVERRQRAEADALERERHQLRLEKERLEREKLDLIRLERERVKKEMELVAARKEMAERRRMEEQRKQEEDRKREEMSISEIDRRCRDPIPRATFAPLMSNPMELQDPRLTLMPSITQSRAVQNEDQVEKFFPRLGVHPGRDPSPSSRLDDRHRIEEARRHEASLMGRADDGQTSERLSRWDQVNASRAKSPRIRDDYNGQNVGQPLPSARNDHSATVKRQRSRSPLDSQRPPTNSPGGGIYGISTITSEYTLSRGLSGRLSPSSNWTPAPAGYQAVRSGLSNAVPGGGGSVSDSRRGPLPTTVTNRLVAGVPAQGGSHWVQGASSTPRVAFPPAFAQPEPSRGFLPPHPPAAAPANSDNFGYANNLMPSGGYRRY